MEMTRQAQKAKFTLGISFIDDDFKLLEQESDKIIVDRYRESSSKKTIHALEGDICESTLSSIKKQLLDKFEEKFFFTQYAHINLIYDCSIVPLISYLSLIDKIYQENHETIEIILPYRYVFKSRKTYLFMAEGETRFKFLYDRGECFSYFIEIYCKEKNIPIKHIKKNYHPFFFYPILRRIIIYMAKLYEDILNNIRNRAFISKLNIKDKNIFLTRSNPSGFMRNQLFNSKKSICLMSESSSFSKDEILNIFDSDDSLYDFLPRLKIVDVLLIYLKNLVKRNKSKEFKVKVFNISIPLKNIIFESNLLKSNLDIYYERLKKITPSKNTLIISKELCSPHAAVEYAYFSNIGCKIEFFQTVDLTNRIFPRIIFGGRLIAYSNWHANRIKNMNPEISVIGNKNNASKIIEIESKQNKVIFFDTEMNEMTSRNKIRTSISKYASDINNKFEVYKHPRDKDRDRNIENLTLKEKLSDASIIFTYPSAIISEIYLYNIPIIILFVGVGRDYKWHWSFDSLYPGCITSIEQIEHIDNQLIFDSYNEFQKKLFLINGLDNDEAV